MSRTANRVGTVATVLAVIGLGLAVYLTWEHFSANPSYFCPANSVIDCTRVTESSWLRFAGIPVAVLGLVYFLVAIPLHLPASWRSTNPWIVRGRWAWSVIGMISVFWLVYGEVDVGAICLYCTGVHVVTFAVLVTTAVGSSLLVPDELDVEEPVATGTLAP